MEHSWWRRVIEGHADLPRLYRTDADPDLDFTGALPDDATVADAWRSWHEEVEHAREEYARHLGHADLLRECVDGRTGQ